MKHLMIGDVTEYLAQQALRNNSKSKIVTQQTTTEFLAAERGFFYTSIGDFSSMEMFCQVLDHADEITFCPPPNNTWSSDTIEAETKEFLYQWSYAKNKPVYNLKTPDFLDPKIDHAIQFHHRITKGQQIWNFGCSITKGTGVQQQQTYGSLLSKQLQLPISVVAHDGSSIKWAADQLLSSDIAQDDIVIWGVTNVNRFGYFLHDSRYYHIYLKFFKNYPLMLNLFEKNILLSPNLVYEALTSIQIANNFCNKIGAHLIMLGVFPYFSDFDNRLHKYKNFVPTGHQLQDFKDLGSDNIHPGPIHHEFYATKVMDYLNNKQILNPGGIA
jgi:hypothetical protein